MNKLSQQTADEILAEALSNINLYFGDAIIPDVPDGFSTRKKRFSKRFTQILNALVSEDKCELCEGARVIRADNEYGGGSTHEIPCPYCAKETDKQIARRMIEKIAENNDLSVEDLMVCNNCSLLLSQQEELNEPTNSG